MLDSRDLAEVRVCGMRILLTDQEDHVGNTAGLSIFRRAIQISPYSCGERLICCVS